MIKLKLLDSRPFVLALLVLFACRDIALSEEPVTYVTWNSLEPDKCIAIWLLKTYVHTNAQFRFVPRGTTITNGIPFDVPGSRYIRNAHQSVSEVVIDLHDIRDEKADALARIARKFELGRWHAEFSSGEARIAGKLQHAWDSRAPPQHTLVNMLDEISAWEVD